MRGAAPLIAILALLAITGAAAAYEAWVAPGGQSTSVVLVNTGTSEGMAWLVHPDGSMTSQALAAGAQVVMPLGQQGPDPGVERAGHRLVTQGRIQAAVHWDAADDAASGLIPTSSLGTHHVLMPMQGQSPSTGDNSISIAASQDETTVQVRFASSARDGTALRPPGYIGTYPLESYEVLTIRGPQMSGTEISSDKPVAVFDHRSEYRTGDGRVGTVAEQVPPTDLTTLEVVSCLPKGTPYQAYALTLENSTGISGWTHDGTFTTQFFPSAGSSLILGMWNGGSQLAGTKALQGMAGLGGESVGPPAIAYAPPQETWLPEATAVIPPMSSGSVARVIAVHDAEDVPVFSTGTFTTHTLAHGSSYACSVSDPLPAGTKYVTVSAAGGVAAWTWTNGISAGTLAAAWPPCLAVDVGVKDLSVHAVAVGNGIAVVWSDPEADCQDTGYMVERSRDGAPYQMFIAQDAPGLVDKTVETCVPYTYRVSRQDGSGTARSQGTVLPDEYDCEGPPDDPVTVCPVLIEPDVVFAGGLHQAPLEVQTDDGDPWTEEVAFTLHVLSQSGIAGSTDWTQYVLRLDVDEAPPGLHEVTLLFEPFTEECGVQEFQIWVAVTGSGGGAPPDGGDDGTDGPPGGSTRPPPRSYVCPALATHTVEAVLAPGERFHHPIALREGGTVGFRFLGDGLRGIPGVAFDSGEGSIDWQATEPGLYTGEVAMKTGEPVCDEEVFFRILVRAEPRREATPPAVEDAEVQGCGACGEDDPSDEPTGPVAEPDPPATTTAPAPAPEECTGCRDAAVQSRDAPGDRDSPGLAMPLVVCALLAFVSRSSGGRRAR